MQNKKNLIILIEIKKRELISKLVLSEIALKNKYRIFICNTSSYFWALKKKVLPKGIILLKSIEQKDIKFLTECKKNNFHVVCQDEEGGQVRTSIANFFKQRVSYKTLKLISSFYSWGKLDNKYPMNKFKKFKSKFKLTGSPRIDLLNKKLNILFQQDVKQLKKKYKNYVLICTNFGLSNGYYTDDEKIKIEIKTRGLKKKSEINWLKNYHKEERKLMFEFIDLCNFLSKSIKNLNFILRPHPAENLAIYKKYIKSKNVIITNEGNSINWIRGAIAHIHNGCTTGFEAFALKKKVFSYEPFKSKFIDNTISNKVSYRIKNKKNFTKKIFYNKKPNFYDLNKKNIFNQRYRFENELNCNEIIKNLDELNSYKTKFEYDHKKFLFKKFKQFIEFKLFDYQFKSKYYKEKNKMINYTEITNFFKKSKNSKNILIKELINGLYLLETKN